MSAPFESEMAVAASARAEAPPRGALRERAREALSRWIVSPLFGMTTGEWLRLLGEARFRVSPAYWPRAALTTLVSFSNSIDARRERARFGAEIERTEVRAPLFVLGHYRSGTTHLHNLLTLDPRTTFTDNLCATNPHTFLSTEAKKRKWGAPLTMSRRPQDDVHLDLEVPAEDELALCAASRLSPHVGWHFPRLEQRAQRTLTLRDVTPEERARWKRAMLDFARKLTLRSGGRRVVFKSPCHTTRIAILLEVFPDAHFVHIRRDPTEVFRSTLHMERTVPPHFAYQRRDPASVEEFVLRRYRAMYDAFFEDVPAIPAGQFHELAYEELKRAPLAVLAELYERLDLGGFDEQRARVESYLAGLASYTRNRYEPLAPEVRERVEQEWARCFDAWGYERSGRRAEMAGVR